MKPIIGTRGGTSGFDLSAVQDGSASPWKKSDINQ
jgi:hypothetical protein